MRTAHEARRMSAKNGQIGRELNRIGDLIEKAARAGELKISVKSPKQWIEDILYFLDLFEFKTSTSSSRNRGTVTINISWEE